MKNVILILFILSLPTNYNYISRVCMDGIFNFRNNFFGKYVYNFIFFINRKNDKAIINSHKWRSWGSNFGHGRPPKIFGKFC
jgi:hypothetical protein